MLPMKSNIRRRGLHCCNTGFQCRSEAQVTSNIQSLPDKLQIHRDVDGSLNLVQCMCIIQKPRHVRLTERAVIGARLARIGEPQVVRILRPPVATLIHIDLEIVPVNSLQLPEWDCSNTVYL